MEEEKVVTPSEETREREEKDTVTILVGIYGDIGRIPWCLGFTGKTHQPAIMGMWWWFTD